MSVTPVASGPPGTAEGLGVQARLTIASVDRFFAFIQSVFQNRSAVTAVAPAAPRPASPERVSPEAPPQRLEPARRRDVRRAESPADREPAESPGNLPETEGNAAPPGQTEPVAEGESGEESSSETVVPEEIRGTLREAVGRLRRLLARLEEGTTFQEAFGELLKILSFLQETTGEIPQDRLLSFFKGLGAEFEVLVAHVRELFETVEAESASRAGRALLSRRPEVTEGAAPATIEDLARALARVLERALKPESAARPAAPVAADAARGVPEGITKADAPRPQGPGAAPAAAAPQVGAIGAAPAAKPDTAAAVPVAAAEASPEAQVARAQPALAARAAPTLSAEVKPAGNAEGPSVRTGNEGTNPGAVARLVAKEPMRLSASQAEAVERIVRMARMSEGEGGRRLQFRLQPPLLGHLRMDLSVRDGVLNGTFHVETPAARAAVLAQVEQLKNALVDQGVSVGSFHVSVDTPEQRAGRNAAEERRPGARQALDRPGSDAAGSAGTAASEEARAARLSYMDVTG